MWAGWFLHFAGLEHFCLVPHQSHSYFNSFVLGMNFRILKVPLLLACERRPTCVFPAVGDKRQLEISLRSQATLLREI